MQNMLKQHFNQNYIYNGHNKNVWKIDVTLWGSVLDYLENQDLFALMLACANRQDNTYQEDKADNVEQNGKIMLWRICKFKLIFNKYFNYTDRSYYFLLFSQIPYLSHQSNRLNNLAITNTFQIFQNLPKQFQQLLRQCQSYVKQQHQNQLGQKLKKMIIDPYLPMPKLIRQTVACATNSNLQTFLIQQFINQMGFQLKEEIFQNIENDFIENQQQTIRSMLKNSQICQTVMYRPYLINAQKLPFLLIKNNNHHNFIVTVLAITNLYIQKIQKYLSTITNQFQLTFQLIMRYNLLSNTVLGIQESFGSIFAAYESMYDQIFQNDNAKIIGQKWYWKAVMAMWAQKMQKFNPKTNKVYISLVDHFCNESLNKKLNQKYAHISSKITLLGLNKNKCNNNQPIGFIQSLLTKQDYELRILLKMYQQSLIDLSINQNLVHFCGHSNHELGQIYITAQKQLLNKQQQFISNLKQLSFNNAQLQILSQFIQDRINILSNLIKPRTLKKIINFYHNEGLIIFDQKFIKNDQQIQNYVNYLQKNNKLPKKNNQKFTINDSLLPIKSLFILNKNNQLDIESQNDSNTQEDNLFSSNQSSNEQMRANGKLSINSYNTMDSQNSSFQFYESDDECYEEQMNENMEIQI